MPATEEIDVGSGGTSMGTPGNTTAVNPTSTTNINPKAEGTIHLDGTIAQFGVIQLVNGTETTVQPIDKIQIPFGENTLFVENVGGSAQWTFKGKTVGTYMDAASLDWPEDMNVPSGSSVSYWVGGTKTDLKFSEFVKMKVILDVA